MKRTNIPVYIDLLFCLVIMPPIIMLVPVDLMSSKEFLDASIKNVIKTLIEAILLVVLVVYVFLQSLRSTFIPAISIIVSLVGTFAFLYAAGFSPNWV